MKQVMLITLGVVVAISLIVGIFTLNQVNQEQLALTSRLESRTQVIADSLTESIEPSFIRHATSSVQRTIDKIAGSERLAGLGVFDHAGAPVSLSSGLAASDALNALVARTMDSNEPSGKFMQKDGQSVYVFAGPLHNAEDGVVGSLVVVQNAEYISESVWQIWRDNLLRLLLQILVIGGAIYVLVRWVFIKPLLIMAESIKAARRGDAESESAAGHNRFFEPLSDEISKMAGSLRQARLVASEEARLRLEKLDTPWTAERLKEFTKAYLKDRPIFVVSNREPYVHTRTKNGVQWSVPAGGLVTALEPVMEACGGMWIAHGSGDADKETAGAGDKISVPPEEPKYTLKRVWLSKKEVQGYYNGFSNEALWPLCLMTHTRPLFRKEDWAVYRKVNGLFAKELLNEIRRIERPLILVQDYHFTLLPALIKKSRPDAQVALFWHIPWPSAAQFSICPWRKELLEGMLGADLVGFHTQQNCNNFIDTVGTEIESRINFEHFSITRANHSTYIKSFPISIAFPGSAESDKAPDRKTLDALNIRTKYLGIGVDRLDYTKGILERFKGVEFFLKDHPEYKNKFTFLQIAAPSRESVQKYREYSESVAAEAERINKLFGSRAWQPIVLERKHYSHEEILPLYQLANVCLVTSLHDGMNLVAKEYAAARSDESGVLVLSQFTGAARDLKTAISVNPYSAEQTAEAIYTALNMPAAEQHRRMKTMRDSVRGYNVYRWSAELIKALVQLD